MRGFQPGEFTLDGESGLNMQLPPSGGMPPQTGGLMQQGGFLGQPFMTGPGNMPGNVPGMQPTGVPPTGVPPTGVPPGGMGVGMPGNLGHMQLAPQGTPLLGNFGQLQPAREPESRPGNMTMPNLGMMAPMWSGDQSNLGNRGPEPGPGRPNIPPGPMGQPMGSLGEGNQIGQQMAILAGGLPQSSGQVMGAFCAQLLGGSMPQGGDLGARPPDKAPDPPGSMDALRQPWMLQELANAAMMRDLDSNTPNLSHSAPRLPEQMPQSSQNNPSLLTLQQQQLILQQLQSSQPGHTAALAPAPQLGFCGMSDLPGPGAMGNQGPGPMPGPQANTTMPQFPNQQLRMQGGMQNFPVNPDYQDVSQQLHDLEDKSRRLYPPGGATAGNFYNPASGGDLGRRMEDDLNQGLLMDLRGAGGKGKAGKPDEKLGQCGLGGKLGSVDRDEFRNTLGGKGGKKGSKDSSRPGFGLTGSGPSGPSGPSGREKGKSKGSGEASFTTSGIGKMRYGNSPNKLFIGNLSLDVTSDDLIEALKPAGEVLGVRLRQGRYSSIAFAEFKHSGCVDVAVRTLQGLVIKGRPARMEFQSGKNERPEDEEPREKGGEKGKGGKGKGRGKGSKGKDAPSIRQPGPVPPGPMAGTLPPRLPVAPASPEA